jgi:hypothetical protein
LKAQEEQFEIYLKAKRAIIAKMNLFQGIPHHVLLENPIFVPVSMAFEPSFIVRRLGKLLMKSWIPACSRRDRQLPAAPVFLLPASPVVRNSRKGV